MYTDDYGNPLGVDMGGSSASPATPEIPQGFNPNKPIAPIKKPTSYYELMLSLSDLGSKERTMKEQQRLAEELRKTDMPGMRGNSRIMAAANPLEMAVAGGSKALGGFRQGQLQREQIDLANEIRRRIQEERMGGYIAPTEGEY
jgi:hypothetical protein